jgi:hypothetical protein
LEKMIGEDIPNKERRVLVVNRPEILDFFPKNWVKPFQKNNVLYLIKMGIFYHLLGVSFMVLGSNIISEAIPNYESPQFPVSISLALSAGMFEEVIFFGIPFYLSGNPLIVLGTGLIWSVSHLFNTGMVSLQTLAYEGFFLSVPHIFFSLRTWVSGKGWFAICFHSAWNIIFLLMYCSLGFRPCNIFNDFFDLINIILAFSSAVIVYFAYLNYVKKKNINQFFYLLPVIVLVLGLLLLLREELTFL